MVGEKRDGLTRDALLWARPWARLKAWRRPRKHFFVKSLPTFGLGLISMLDIRLIVDLLIVTVILDSYTFPTGS